MNGVVGSGHVSQSDLGSMLLATVRYSLRCVGGYTAEYAGGLVRRFFASCDDYDQRQIVTEIEIAGIVERKTLPTSELELWNALLEEIRPPKASFTIDYRCGKCKRDGLKLWRGVHGCADKDGNKLLCAACLAPDTKVDAEGRAPWFSQGHEMSPTDQIAGWLPAVPTGDTYWGYSSVPTADVRWWKALPTYVSPQVSDAQTAKGPQR